MAATAAKARGATLASVYQTLPIVGPTAGMDLRTSPTLLPPTRARLLVNFSLTEPGALVVRPGYLQFSTSSLGASRPQGGARVYLNTAVPTATSTNVTLVGWNGSIYTQTDSGGWVGPTLTNLSTNELDFVSDRDLVAVFDGASSITYKSTNGSSWTRFGIAAPSTSGTASSLSTGGLSSGRYGLTFTYKDRDLATESNAPAESTITLTASSGAVNFVVPNSTDVQVDAICCYARAISEGETILRKVSSQAQSAGANSTFVVTSTAWTQNAEVPTDHDLPPALSFGVVWKSRWWARDAAVTNRIRFTQLFQPQSWPALFYIDIPFERGDDIRALVPLGDTLLIFGTTKIFVILGQTSLDFEVRPTLGSQDGAFGPHCVATIENGVVHAAASGVYIFDGTTDRLLSFDLDPGWRDLVQNTAVSQLARIPMVYHQRLKELRIAVPRLYPFGTVGEWILDLNQTRTTNQSAWTATDRNIGGYIPWDGPESASGNRGRLFSWASDAAVLTEEATGTSANGGNLTAQYEGPGLTLGPFRARWIDLRGEYQPVSGSFTVEPVIDGVSFGAKSVTLVSPGASYGTATYGVDVYGGVGRKMFHKMLPLSADGHTFVLKAVYTGQQTFRWFAYHPGFVPESQSRAFSE